MERYQRLLQDVSAWFNTVQEGYAQEMQCGRGCIQCCLGLFDISLPDALLAVQGFLALPEESRECVVRSAEEIQKKIFRQAPDFKPPYLMAAAEDALIDRITTRISDPRCPFLHHDDSCMIYEYRPLACRLEGIPMVDRRDGLFGDWCECNFPDGVASAAQRDLQRNYYEIQETERSSTEDLSEMLLGKRQESLTIFIPSLIVRYTETWIPLLTKVNSAIRCSIKGDP